MVQREIKLLEHFFKIAREEHSLKGGGKLFHMTEPANLAVLLPYCVEFTLEIKMSPLDACRVRPSHGKCKFSAWKVKPCFHIVVSGLSWSLLNLNDHMETWMKLLQRQVTTVKDSQRLGRWDRLEVYLSYRERP